MSLTPTRIDTTSGDASSTSACHRASRSLTLWPPIPVFSQVTGRSGCRRCHSPATRSG
ncbi:prepilin peptidase [Streptomyces sp. GS7]|uniref:prepilin peptidase n=1 Tax=Streptomyces sp. GS7 TaxID=2692234 RepID=UPI003FA75306